MTTINVGGLSENLPTNFSKYSDAFKKAESAMKLLLNVCASPDFETREGWSKTYEKNGERVYSKQFNVGKIFTLRIIYDVPMQSLFDDHWDNITTTPEWNPNFAYMERIKELTSHCDILKYATTDIMFVKGREFLACRLYRRIGPRIYVAARSFNIDEIPETKGKVRAEMPLGAGRFSPYPDDPTKTCIDYAVCVNPKIRLPQRLIDTCIAYTVHRDSVFARKNVQKWKGRYRSQETTQVSERAED